MQTALLSYAFDDEPVRVVMVAGEPWFVAHDVAKALGYSEAAFMTRLLDDDEKGLHNVQTPGGSQQVIIISESGLYHAALKRRGKDAQRFRRWVTEEVLPAIRKTGKYVLHTPPSGVLLTMSSGSMAATVGLLREARRLFGVGAARRLWVELGLPASIAEARDDGPDPMLAGLRDWLTGRVAIVAEEATRALFGSATAGQHERILMLLRLLGWSPRAVSEAGRKRTFWFPPGEVSPPAVVEGGR